MCASRNVDNFQIKQQQDNFYCSHATKTCTDVELMILPFSRTQTTHEQVIHTNLFCYRDLDLDPMTLIYELDLDMSKM